MIRTKYYILEVDKSKRRLYSKLIGTWTAEKIAIQLKQDTIKCLKEIGDYFTILVDFTDFRVPDIMTLERIKQAQKSCISMGMVRSAEVASRSAFTSLAIDKIKKANNISAIDRKRFNTKEEANNWLDEVLVSVA